MMSDPSSNGITEPPPPTPSSPGDITASASMQQMEESWNGAMAQNAQRFPAWMAVAVFSAICVAALDSRKEAVYDEGWAFAVVIVSLVISFGAIVGYLCFRGIFVGGLPEIAAVTVLLGFWAAGLPAIMNPSNGLAVAEPVQVDIPPVVLNANLYFFSWASFIGTVYLCGSLLQESVLGGDISATSTKSACWFGLIASTLVVMGTSVRTFKASECGNTDVDNNEYPTQLCRRTKFAISIGSIYCVVSAIMSYLTHKGLLSLVVETIFTTIQLVVWCFGVGYITFGESPGATIGNLYFSAWITFILTVFLFGQCFREYVAGRAAAARADDSNGQSQQQPQEAYDDTI